MATGKMLTASFMNEVILYGGIPLTRANVYRQALQDTGSRKAADMFAFGSAKKAPASWKPITLTEFRRVIGSARRKARKRGK